VSKDGIAPRYKNISTNTDPRFCIRVSKDKERVLVMAAVKTLRSREDAKHSELRFRTLLTEGIPKTELTLVE
jgi:hypothetical protein